ncbi:hypothetical protein XA68_14750 [Ophiocordyceps unilateralis]|uniref:Uncharacterized protein n=1 Tax=Ophiocordyceps unilateralis TaxID=268505 RepID=A0A2A9P9H4_OPHUN|nr:hypothetical protein XA68_14750 [Ophiocordyceps unilateralis]
MHGASPDPSRRNVRQTAIVCRHRVSPSCVAEKSDSPAALSPSPSPSVRMPASRRSRRPLPRPMTPAPRATPTVVPPPLPVCRHRPVRRA